VVALIAAVIHPRCVARAADSGGELRGSRVSPSASSHRPAGGVWMTLIFLQRPHRPWTDRCGVRMTLASKSSAMRSALPLVESISAPSRFAKNPLALRRALLGNLGLCIRLQSLTPALIARHGGFAGRGRRCGSPRQAEIPEINDSLPARTVTSWGRTAKRLVVARTGTATTATRRCRACSPCSMHRGGRRPAGERSSPHGSRAYERSRALYESAHRQA